jgi:hypothetical protein
MEDTITLKFLAPSWWLDENPNIPTSHIQRPRWPKVMTLRVGGLLQMLECLKGLKNPKIQKKLEYLQTPTYLEIHKLHQYFPLSLHIAHYYFYASQNLLYVGQRSLFSCWTVSFAMLGFSCVSIFLLSLFTVRRLSSFGLGIKDLICNSKKNMVGCHIIGYGFNWEFHGFHPVRNFNSFRCSIISVDLQNKMMSSMPFHFFQMKGNYGWQTSPWQGFQVYPSF